MVSFILMIQTILLTALSAQIILKPTVTPAPQTPQSAITRVLTNKNDVAFAVEQNNTTYTLKLKKLGDTDVIPLPELQKDIVNNDKLLQPTTAISLSPVINAISPTVEPTETPVPTMMPTPAPVTVTVAPATVNTASGISEEAITFLGNCEAGMNPARNSGNGYYGAFQFSYGTWKSMNTGYERADLAPIEVQKAAVRQLLQRSSIYNQFPGCARRMHSTGLI